MPNTSISYFARTNARKPHRIFGIKQADRLSHMYVIGKTGTGKSTLLETLIRQDIVAGRGAAFIDPHGDLVERIAGSIPERRNSDTIYLDVASPKLSFGYNPFVRVSPGLRPLVASGLMDVFKKLWSDSWGPRMEHILRNALLALLDQPEAAMPDILSLLTDKSFRYRAVTRINNAQVRAFWRDEFPKYSLRIKSDGISPIQNKVGAFLADPKLRRILTRGDGAIRLRKIMDEGKVLLINLSHGKIGADSAGLLGGLMVTSLGSAAFSRAFIPEAKRRPFFLYVDEFQSFTTLSFANMLAELRKFGVGAVLSHQYRQQLEPDIRHAVLGNAGTLISFRLGSHDASLIADEFAPIFSRRDLLTLPNHDIYVKLMIDGAPSKPFSATTLRPPNMVVSKRVPLHKLS
ncbi:type IV secretory system conjugative DNA transfer family protein [Mesorhizobium sp. 10J20-29]